MGRSLGDSCLNDGNILLTTRRLDRIIAFDQNTGRLTAEAGITFDAIMRFSIPRGWFLPVTPGTRFVSLGGAVANDVHGKNHHSVGTFGHHVVCFQLRRSDGSSLLCSAGENSDWFRATIGGLGLTGLIEWVESPEFEADRKFMDRHRDDPLRRYRRKVPRAQRRIRVGRYEYVVAWTDTLSRKAPGRGLFMRGNHNADPERRETQSQSRPAPMSASPECFRSAC